MAKVDQNQTSASTKKSAKTSKKLPDKDRQTMPENTDQESNAEAAVQTRVLRGQPGWLINIHSNLITLNDRPRDQANAIRRIAPLVRYFAKSERY